MNIIIVGCGKVGETVAHRLNNEDNNITILDIDEKKVTAISQGSDIMGYTGSGTSAEILRDVDAANADLLIALTNSDERNILCCLIAKNLGVKRVMARVRTPDYRKQIDFLQNDLKIMPINPELTAASEIARILQFPSAIGVDTFMRDKVELLTFKLPDECVLEGMPVKSVVTQIADVLVCIVKRDGAAFIPNGDFVFEKGDVASIIAPHKEVHKFFKKIKYKNEPVRDVMIVGGGETGYYLASDLKRSGISVKLIEKDKERCDELSTALEGVNILWGEANAELLLEEGVASAEGFVALTNVDVENILLSLSAAEHSTGRKKIITKINRTESDSLINRLSQDLDTIIHPKELTADTIARHVRAMKNTIGSNVETLYNVVPGQIEAAEFRIVEGSPIIGKNLRDLHFKDSTLIAAISRNNRPFIPRGVDKIEARDSVVVVTKIKALTDIQDILE
ncbi:MAG: Trk system potassium transporter TrkA [Oscillospiraceae bacterium]|nr:Trk system potassium transporter TrkA [Oscillospiraceae bacterium]